MKFICLAYEEEATLNAMSSSEWEALRAETMGYVDQLRESGTYVTSEALESIETATTVRVRDGRLSTTDGPFAETKETLGGIIVIDVRNLDEAISVAAKWPSARFGSIEVRPVVGELRSSSRYGQP
jgi:hypothetical protein